MDDGKKENLRHDDEKQEQDTGADNYEFLKETIKERPIDKKKLARHAGFLAAGGILFGLAAALTFAYVEPKIEKNVQSKETRNPGLRRNRLLRITGRENSRQETMLGRTARQPRWTQEKSRWMIIRTCIQRSSSRRKNLKKPWSL